MEKPKSKSEPKPKPKSKPEPKPKPKRERTGALTGRGVYVSLSPAQRDTLDRAAAVHRVTVPAWIRRVLFG